MPVKHPVQVGIGEPTIYRYSRVFS